MMATIGLRRPEKRSGLPIERYDKDTLSRRLGPDYELRRAIERQHVTPSGATQDFTYALFQRAR